MATRKQLTLHLDDATARALEAEARLRGLTLSRAANDGLKRVLLEEKGASLVDTVKARLDRLDQRDTARARDMALLRETLLAFVRLWLTYAGPLEFDPDDTSADQRFDAFLDDVVRGLKAG
ncbi:MAG: hypothetical protein MUF14_02190 [Hyphomonadaceae bacterium]|jgi:hypothetical protein|nr:hypothetical protein [Hyphomonadaceae bacterium]